MVVAKQNIESGVLCCHSGNPAEKPMCVLPIPMPSPPLRWQLEGARSSPLLFGILELCAPSSSPTPLPIISPISEQGIVFNLHTWNEKSVGNYIYHIPWWKWKDKWQIGRCRVHGRCNNIWTHLGCTEIKALLWSETLLKDSSDNLSKTVLAKERRKWGIFCEKVQISDT